MCLTINKFYHPDLKAKIAEKDIYTLKVSKYDMNTKKPISYYQNTLQYYNIILQSDLIFKRFSNDKIKQGLHSLINGITGTMYNDNFDIICIPKIFILCRIPKGSEYFIGMNNDIVSNQLELIQPIIGNDKYFNYSKINSMKYNLINNKLWNICVKHCKKAGYKIGL